MNGRERIKAIINHESTDRCAYWTGITSPSINHALFEHLRCDTTEQIWDKLGDDLRWIHLNSNGHRLITRTDTGEFCASGFMKDAEYVSELDAYSWPDADKIDLQPCLKALEETGDYYRLTGCLSMFFHKDCFFAFGSMQNYFIKMYTSPDLVHAVTKRANDFYIRLNRRYFKAAADKADASFVSHDLGTQLNLLISPEMLEEFVFPYLKQQIDLAHEFGLHAVLHSCGAISAIIPRLIELGVDVLHPIQALAAGMDADSLKRYKNCITFLGGIDTQQLLVHGTPEEVFKEVIRITGILGPMIVSPSHEVILGDVPPENICAISKAVMCQELLAR